jgi:hypothetical protein
MHQQGDHAMTPSEMPAINLNPQSFFPPHACKELILMRSSKFA